MTNTKHLIEVNNLLKYFNVGKGLAVHAVDDVSFNIDSGESLGLVGESGCGKTTVGRLLLRLIPADSGEIKFEDVNILTLNNREFKAYRQKMQIVFQDPFSSLDPRKNVEQIISEPLQNYHYGKKSQIQDRVHELLLEVGLSGAEAKKYQHEMDGGRCQRVGIARALALYPRFIICDEPVSALDVSVQAQILNLLKKLQVQLGLSTLFISHNLAVVKHMCSRIIVMYLGKILEIAKTEDLFQRPLHPYTKALLSAVPIPDPSVKRNRIILEGDVPTPVNPPVGCRFAKRCVYADSNCYSITPYLCESTNGHKVACLKWNHFNVQNNHSEGIKI